MSSSSSKPASDRDTEPFINGLKLSQIVTILYNRTSDPGRRA